MQENTDCMSTRIEGRGTSSLRILSEQTKMSSVVCLDKFGDS